MLVSKPTRKGELNAFELFRYKSIQCNTEPCRFELVTENNIRPSLCAFYLAP